MCSIKKLTHCINDTATTEIYTLSLHDALPIYRGDDVALRRRVVARDEPDATREQRERTLALEQSLGSELLLQSLEDRKSTRLNSSHANISYAVFCLNKKYF